MSPAPGAAERADGSGEMFDAIAGRYDILNRILSLGRDRAWRRIAVRALDLRPGDEALDLATGTADVALEIVRLHPGVRVTGVDPSPGMLRVGEGKVRRAGAEDRIVLERGEAVSLPWEEGRFAAVVVAFGVRNFPDRLAGLREMRRVVRPGGRAAVLELTRPSFLPAALWVRFGVPLLGRLLSRGAAYEYLRRSIESFPPPGEFTARMEEAGWRLLDARPLACGAAHLFVAVNPEEGPAVSG